MHKTRQNRKANEKRRKQLELKHAPLPIAEQQKRCAERQAAHQRRYPDPPKYDVFAHVSGKPIAEHTGPKPYTPKARFERLTLQDLIALFYV